ncbi:tyrosine-type recombinase/integrase [Microbacterium sp. KNMS]
MQNDEVIRRFGTWLEATGRANGTVALRMRHVRQLARRTTLTLADDDVLTAALAATRHLAPDTRHSILASWRLFYGWATRKRLVMADPTLPLGSIPVPVKMPKVAPDRDVADALRGASLRDRALVMLGRYGCLRLSEMTRAHMRDRDGDRLRVLGKGGKERIVYLNDPLLAALKQIERELPRGYYFPGETDGHLHTQSVHKIVKRVTGWNPHALRHAGATAAYRATGDLRAVQEMLGHASLATTQRYLHLDDDARRRAAAGTVIDLGRPRWAA